MITETAIGNAEIVEQTDDGYGNPAVVINRDDGTFEIIDRRCVNTSDLTPGKRGTLEYRDCPTGARTFFDPA